MAEGFTAADYVTNIRLSEVKGKRLWLVRVPRHIDPARLEVSRNYVDRLCVGGVCTEPFNNAIVKVVRRWVAFLQRVELPW